MRIHMNLDAFDRVTQYERGCINLKIVVNSVYKRHREGALGGCGDLQRRSGVVPN